MKKSIIVVMLSACLTLAALSGCGKKAPPLPPYEKTGALYYAK